MAAVSNSSLSKLYVSLITIGFTFGSKQDSGNPAGLIHASNEGIIVSPVRLVLHNNRMKRLTE